MDFRDPTFKYHKMGDEYVEFGPAYEDHTSATVNYYGYIARDSSGAWMITKVDMSTAVYAYTYVVGTTGFATAWTNRASQTYVAFNAL